MLIAAQKYEENIAEYVLYMWHLEDMIRACKFDMNLIRANLILPQVQDEDTEQKVSQWYTDLITKMHSEGIQDKGHLGEVNEVMIELLYLHNSLVNISKDKEYEAIYNAAEPLIKEYAKEARSTSMNPIEICLKGQYAKLMLKLQGKAIPKQADEAFETFRKVLVYLSKKYRQMKLGTYTPMSN